MTTTTEVRIKRMQLPPANYHSADEMKWGRHDTYAEVSCGGITAEVLRFCCWDESGGLDDADSTFEVRINGMPDNGAGTCELYATSASRFGILPPCVGKPPCCSTRCSIWNRWRAHDRCQATQGPDA